MAKADTDELPEDDLDAFFNAAESKNPLDIKLAAENVVRHSASADDVSDAEFAAGADVLDPGSPEYALREDAARAKRKGSVTRTVARSGDSSLIPPEDAAELTLPENLEGKFIAIDPAAFGEDSDAPFVLIPAHVYTYVPWWGWVAIALGILMLIAGVVLMPKLSLDRLASRLGDSSEANVQFAMRQLVIGGDKRTVQKLYRMASSQEEALTTRLRAIDTMTLIQREPEVDRALLRLELSSETSEQVREAAIAARKQREAARTRTRGR